MTLSDLRRSQYDNHNTLRYYPVSESDLLSVLTDEALVGELVKRGVLQVHERWRKIPNEVDDGWPHGLESESG